MNCDRKKPGVAFWATVVLVAVLAYPLSFGPACWITSWSGLPGKWLVTVYRPMAWALESKSGILFDATTYYSFLGASKGWGWWTDANTGRVYDFAP